MASTMTASGMAPPRWVGRDRPPRVGAGSVDVGFRSCRGGCALLAEAAPREVRDSQTISSAHRHETRAWEIHGARSIVGGRRPCAAVPSAEGKVMADTATPERDAPIFGVPEAEDGPSTAGAALDLLLTEAGLDTRERFLPGRETVRLVTGLARRPGRVVRRGSALTGELAKVVAGRSELEAPARRPPVPRPGMVRQLALPPAAAGLSRHGRDRRRGHRRCRARLGG